LKEKKRKTETMPVISVELKTKMKPLIFSQDGTGDSAVAALATSSETPERLWNLSMRRAAAEEAAHLAAAARTAQAAAIGGSMAWSPGEEYSGVRHAGLDGELFVGGAYVRLFLKDPQYQLR
jgi:DnaJ homolog subfamily C member 13